MKYMLKFSPKIKTKSLKKAKTAD